MKTCKEVPESLSSYLDDDLKQEVVDEMRKHIGVCTDCRAEFDTMTMTIRLYRHFQKPEMATGCHDRLLKILELEKLKTKRDEPSGSGA